MLTVRDISVSLVSRLIHVRVGGLTRGMGAMAIHSRVWGEPAIEDPLTSILTSGGGGAEWGNNITVVNGAQYQCHSV